MNRFRAQLLVAAAVLTAVGTTAHAQLRRWHVGNVAVGGTGQFTTVLTANPTPAPATSPYGFVTSTPLRQDTTLSAGGVASVQMHPFAWMGVQLNYGFSHYQERFQYQYTSAGINNAIHTARVATDWHEATAGYLFHPKLMKLAPYVAVGGGAIDFNPRGGSTANSAVTGTAQWRGAGYLETGLDLPTKSRHISFRVAGRSLFYRAPNYDTPAISTRSWRVTSEPTLSAVYKF